MSQSDWGTERSAPDRAGPSRSVPVHAERYLVSALPDPRQVPGEATGAQRVIEALAEDPEVRVIRVIKSTTTGSTPVAVVEMAPEHAATLAGSRQFYVEADHPLRYGMVGLLYADPAAAPFQEGVELTVAVDDGEGVPLAGAEVHVLGDYPARGVTGDDGRATVTVAGHGSVSGIYVQPRHDHWSAWLARPRLHPNDPVRVACRRIDPARAQAWSRRAMGFDRLPPTFRGHGVRVAVVDSGVATAHGDLAGRVVSGRDVVGQDDKSWQEDAVGFGTMAAGLIAATPERSHVVGLAPEAEVHVCKVYPGGRSGDLIEALDYCIEQHVDIIDLGVGSPYPSLLLAGKIEEARRAGIACIAGAGSNAGPVSFPASLPTVLAVAAIGKLGTFPPDSYHATQLSGTPTPEGFFTARFSAYGPEIDLCAPGIGVVSTVPPDTVGALDGTAVAVPHVAALAALVLAHHPDFRGGYLVRGAARVDRLFEILRASCRPLPFHDRLSVGAGLPDAVIAVGLAPAAHQIPPGLAVLGGAMAQAGLLAPAGWPGAGPPPPYDVGEGGAPRGMVQLRAAMRSAGLAPEAAPVGEPPAEG